MDSMKKSTYKVTGAQDWEGGWLSADIKDAPKIELPTPLGTIIAQVSTDSKYAGIYLSFRANGSNYERTVALLENEDPEGDNTVALKVWEDGADGAEYSQNITIQKPKPEISERIRRAERVLIDNGIDPDEVVTVLQALGYVLLDADLYDNPSAEIFTKTDVTYQIRRAERVLADNGIDPDETDTVLQALGYALLDTELYPES